MKMLDDGDSPYNPEGENLVDLDISATPSVVAQNDADVDFTAYKDIIAYDDIMKNKVGSIIAWFEI